TARGSEALVSETIITDNNWHHIGLVWDGSYRTLYIDDVIAAADENKQETLSSSTTGLYIGAGKNLESDSLWMGMIDDVRIYNRAINP
ncbi:MAG: LamG domain-containing protein, partial [Sedimentisphaerales bacterium]|nr:LamG domain-containing protein [Sedimentisphaerales bacterium]